MRIGIEAQRIFRAEKHGMDFVAIALIRELQQIDTENQYFIFVNRGPDNKVIEETANFKIICFSGLYPIWEQVLLPLKARALKLDLLHSTSNTAPLYFSKKQVVTIHDVIYLEKQTLFNKDYNWYQKFGNLYRKSVVKKLLSRVDRIITVSEFEKKRFINARYARPDRIRVVHNGVSEHFRKISDEEYLSKVKSQYGLPDNYFLFLANTDPKKNTRNTVFAFAHFCLCSTTQHKMVVGDIAKSIILRYLKELDQAQLIDRFVFTGYIPQKDLPAIMNMAEVFLYPSLRESFGLPLLEAMRCETPVLTSKTSSMPEIAGPAALYVNPQEPESISEALQQLVAEPEIKTRLIERGKQRSTYFSWRNTAVQTLNVYRQLAH